MPLDYFIETYPSNAFVQAQSMLAGFKTVFKEYDGGLPNDALESTLSH
jgi:hypothetical protein